MINFRTTTIIQTTKLSDLFKNYFEDAKKNHTIPGIEQSTTIDQNAIDKCALSFITSNCGEIFKEITDNENLNDDIINLFAQTFVRHFWNNSIGYDNDLSFWLKLRAFFDENLPLWAQFFKNTIVDKQSMITSISNVSINNNGTMHVETEGNNDGRTTSNNNEKTTSNVGVTNVSKSNIGTTKTTHTNTGTDENTKNHNLSAHADTPQSETGLHLNDDNEEDDNPLNGYNFSYASSVDGENNSMTHHADQKGDTTENDTTGSTESANGNTQSDSNADSKNVTVSSDKTTNSSDQNTGSTTRQNNLLRNESLFAVAKEMNELANGVYNNLFIKMKREGLFLGTY